MKYHDLRDFLSQLEKTGELKRVAVDVDTRLEMTEICDRVLRAGGPAILFEKPKGHNIPVLANLFGTPKRVALGMGEESVKALREVGKLLAYLKEPEPPKGLKDAWDKLPILKQVLNMAPKKISNAPCQEIVWEGKDVDLSRLPIQHCWPGDIAPLITWGLVVTKGPHKNRQNLGIYRQQVLGPNKVIMRWLAHRGGALDFRDLRAARVPLAARTGPHAARLGHRVAHPRPAHGCARPAGLARRVTQGRLAANLVATGGHAPGANAGNGGAPGLAAAALACPMRGLVGEPVRRRGLPLGPAHDLVAPLRRAQGALLLLALAAAGGARAVRAAPAQSHRGHRVDHRARRDHLCDRLLVDLVLRLFVRRAALHRPATALRTAHRAAGRSHGARRAQRLAPCGRSVDGPAVLPMLAV